MKFFLSVFFSTFFIVTCASYSDAATKNVAILPAPISNLSHAPMTYEFISCVDGKDDFYSLRASNSPKDLGILLVYLHGLAGDFHELYKSGLANAIDKAFPSLSLLSSNYGHTPSWGSAVSRIDITNNIRHVMTNTAVKQIVLIGTSMGASTALAYAATAPNYIKNKIIGVVAVAPCAELADLYQQTMAPEVKTSLEAALGGNPADKAGFYHQNSVDAGLGFLSHKIKIAIITAKEDTLVPIALQMDVVRDFNNRDMNTKCFELQGKSEPPPVDSIMEGLHFVLQ
jgi:pimeloyl-ACP methyl ester carboxylesterase